MDICIPVNHEVSCDAIEPLLEVFLQDAGKHGADLEKMHLEEQANRIGGADNHHDQLPILGSHSRQNVDHHGHSHGHSDIRSRHSQHQEDIVGAKVWTGLLGFLHGSQNVEVQTKQMDMTGATFLADEQRPGLVNFAEERQEEPTIATEVSAASIHDSRVPRFRSGPPWMLGAVKPSATAVPSMVSRWQTRPPRMLGARKPPPMAVPSMGSRWQTSDLCARKTRSVIQIQKPRGTSACRIREFHTVPLGAELAP